MVVEAGRDVSDAKRISINVAGFALIGFYNVCA